MPQRFSLYHTAVKPSMGDFKALKNVLLPSGSPRIFWIWLNFLPGADGCKNIVYRSWVGHFCYLWLSVAGDGPWADPEKMFWKFWSMGSNGARNENSESSWLDDTTEVRRSSSRWTVPGSNPPLAVWLPLKKVPQASFVCFTSFNGNFKSYFTFSSYWLSCSLNHFLLKIM